MGKRKKSSKDDTDLVESILKKVKKMVKRRRIESSSDEEQHVELTCDLENSTEIPINEDPLDTEKDTDKDDLEPDILDLLGFDPSQDKCFGDNLQKDLAVRWKHILLNGLPKEEKANLLKKYLPAENCSIMKAPKLNPEIKSALSELNHKKDSYSEQKQNQMTSCLAAIGKSLNIALSQTENVGNQELIKSLSDAGRLLCDTHYRESISRRYTIINSISKYKRDVIKNTKTDEFLFGSDLSDHLRSSKAISKSASELKPTTSRGRYYQQVPGQPSTSGQRRPDTLNARGAPRTATAGQRVNPQPQQSRRQGPPLTAPVPPPPPPPAQWCDRYRGTNRTRTNYSQKR